jgi:hypothetical protein
MVGMAHVVLHLGLCSSMAQASPSATLPIRVRLTNRTGHTDLQQTFRVQRGSDPTKTVEFDIGRGVYAMQIDSPKYGCAAADYVSFLPDRNRAISETLSSAPQRPPVPLLLQGTAPLSFLYAKPTVVLFAKGTACDKPVDDPLPADVRMENDRDSFYISLTADPNVQSRAGVMALSVQSATGENHYVRIPIPYVPQSGWPSTVQFNVTDDIMDFLAGKPVDTLLCPHLLKTSVG